MKLLLTGANSYIGARLYKDLKENYDLAGTYHSTPLFDDLVKLDITDKENVKRVVKEVKPNYIIHNAAVVGRDLSENEKDFVKKTNEEGTQHLVDAANEIGAKIIYISSFAAIHPTTIYGQTKRAAEEIVKKTTAGYVILRISVTIGLSANVAADKTSVKLLKNIRGEEPAVWDTSWKFQPTYVKHLREVIECVIKEDILDETITVAVPELITKYQLAKDILTPFGITVQAEDKKENAHFLEKIIQLQKLHLPTYSYEQMIQSVIDEFKNA